MGGVEAAWSCLINKPDVFGLGVVMFGHGLRSAFTGDASSGLASFSGADEGASTDAGEVTVFANIGQGALVSGPCFGRGWRREGMGQAGPWSYGQTELFAPSLVLCCRVQDNWSQPPLDMTPVGEWDVRWRQLTSSGTPGCIAAMGASHVAVGVFAASIPLSRVLLTHPRLQSCPSPPPLRQTLLPRQTPAPTAVTHAAPPW